MGRLPPLSFFGRGDSVKGDHQGPLSRAIKGRMFHRNMRVGPGNFPGPVTDGSAARGRTTNRPVFLSPRKLYLVYMGLSRKEDIRRGFRRLRAASDFALGGKVTKTPLGTAPMGTSVPIVAYPTPSVAPRHLPLTGGVGPRPLLRGTRTC